jgi:hypothetical protein
MDPSKSTRGRRSPAPAIWKLLGLRRPQRIDKNVEALLSSVLKFIVSPYTSIWRTLFQIANEVLNSIGGYPNTHRPITNPFILNQQPIGSILSSYQTYPAYNYLDAYVSAISFGLKLLQNIL